MLKLQNEKLKAMFDWIKTPMGLFFLASLIALFCIEPGFLLGFLLFPLYMMFFYFCVRAFSKIDRTAFSAPKKVYKTQENLPTNSTLRFFKFLFLYSFIFLGLGSCLNTFLSMFNFSECCGLLENTSRTASILIGFPVCVIFFPLFLTHLFHIRGIALVTPSPSKIHPIHLCILFLSGLSYFILLAVCAILNDVDLHGNLPDLGLLFTFVAAIFITSLSAKTALKKRIFMKKN